MSRIDHKTYISSLSPELRATLLDMLIDLLPLDGALEGAAELEWIVEHISAASPLMDARVQLALSRHRDDPPMPSAQLARIEDQMRAMFADLPDVPESPPTGWEERLMEKFAQMQRDEARAKRREWWRSLWARLVGRR